MQGELYCTILAGGKGERLWPLSRTKKPKQLLPFFNRQSLLEHTINRVQSIVEKDHLWIVTSSLHQNGIAQEFGSKVGTIISEPSAQNTAPAILLTCLEIYEKNPQAIVAFIPADHWIQQNELFQQSLLKAYYTATITNSIVLLGVQPTYPATGYGYIEYTQEQEFAHGHTIKNFHEKPSQEIAKKYISNNNMLWNIGIFCAKVITFIEHYKQYVPNIFATLQEYRNNQCSYDAIQSISFDHAILERSKNNLVIPVNFWWSDVGNLETFLTLQNSKQTTLALESHNNIVYVPNKLVALIGIENICIVETEDALLIAQRKDVEKVKTIVNTLKINNFQEYL